MIAKKATSIVVNVSLPVVLVTKLQFVRAVIKRILLLP